MSVLALCSYLAYASCLFADRYGIGYWSWEIHAVCSVGVSVSLALCVTKTKLSDIVHAVNILKNLLGFSLT